MERQRIKIKTKWQDMWGQSKTLLWICEWQISDGFGREGERKWKRKTNEVKQLA